jgi:hypothetical protein
MEGSPVKKNTKTLSTRMVSSRSEDGAAFTFLLKFCFEAREIRRWRNEKLKKLKATNPLGSPMTVEDV